MKTITIAAVTAITAMFAVDYASAQERSGLDEKTKKEIREMSVVWLPIPNNFDNF